MCLNLTGAFLRLHPFRCPLPLRLTESFLRTHPYQVPIDDSYSVRFASLPCAARSAMNYKSCVVDEKRSETYSLSDAMRICYEAQDAVEARLAADKLTRAGWYKKAAAHGKQPS